MFIRFPLIVASFAFLALAQDDSDDGFTGDDLEILSTRLEGFQGCSIKCCGGKLTMKQLIKNAFLGTRPVMDVIRGLKPDFNEAPAVDFLGPPGFNGDYQGQMKGMALNTLTITITLIYLRYSQ